MLLLVLVAMRIAARPETWAWMFPDEQTPTAQPAAKQPSVSEIDHDVRLDDGEVLPPDGFRSTGRKDPENPAESQEFANPPATEDEGGSQEHIRPDTKADPLALDAELFADVADNTLGIRRNEASAYYALLARARDVPQRELEAAALSDVSYPLLMLDAQRFRGKLLSIQGDLKRLHPLQPGENNAGVDRLYDAWIITADSGNNLYRVVCTEIADGLPQGDEIRESIPVRVTGFFFKKEGYAARKGLHTAPVLLAKRLDRLPAPADTAPTVGLGPYLIGIAAVVAAAIGTTLWYYRAGDRRAGNSRRKGMTQGPDGSIQHLDSVESEDPVQFLRDLTVPAPATTETTSGKPAAGTAPSESADVKSEGDADN